MHFNFCFAWHYFAEGLSLFNKVKLSVTAILFNQLGQNCIMTHEFASCCQTMGSLLLFCSLHLTLPSCGHLHYSDATPGSGDVWHSVMTYHHNSLPPLTPQKILNPNLLFQKTWIICNVWRNSLPILTHPFHEVTASTTTTTVQSNVLGKSTEGQEHIQPLTTRYCA